MQKCCVNQPFLLKDSCVGRAINFAAGYFHSPQFFYGDEEIGDSNITSWNLNPKNGLYSVISDLISKMNADGNGYATDFIWVGNFIFKK